MERSGGLHKLNGRKIGETPRAARSGQSALAGLGFPICARLLASCRNCSIDWQETLNGMDFYFHGSG